MDPFGIEFGKTLGQLVGEDRVAFAWVALFWHLAAVVVVYLVIRYGNRYRRLFAAYFALDYLWLVGFVGIWVSVELYERMGAVALAVYGATPVFLLVIALQWLRELRAPTLDLDFRHIEKWRLLVAVPLAVWGFWYPPYIYGVRLVFDPAELLFGAYGLMGCPTTMVALSLLFLVYPAGGRQLFHLLTAYAVFVGAAMVALLYVPDIPFFALGVASLALVGWVRHRDRSVERNTRPATPSPTEESAEDSPKLRADASKGRQNR
ncbi:hypothetical protein [Actinomycetospora cinnamomea]|uniref:Uncharacterized protein n=1 Tax=Actinomycetospora cinnamomea TaxID=663609 RepID=A0A2U1F2C4_9PSEU|nr:hypothetical protein [Actinomycetospora cinnamomea]PVZ06279.1 hypothetical protein C8D89_11317 [Actinomycetospora cinnamomea]